MNTDTLLSEDRPAPATISATRTIFTLLLSGCLAILLAAPGIVHAGHGMDDGRARDVTLAVGNAALNVSQDAHLTGPWDAAQSALGRDQQPAVPPLLSLAPPPSSLPHRTAPILLVGGMGGKLQPAPVSTPRLSPHIVRGQGAKPALRRPTRLNPLRLLITGDSLPGYLGPEVLNQLVPTGRVRGWTDTHNGTGLTRPDFVDWSVVARQQVRTYNPEATVVLMGGNDFQNMVVANGRVLIAGTPAWTQEYARRIAVCMRIWTQGWAGRRVYWLSLPPARDAGWAHDFFQINRAIRQAASVVPGALYTDVLGPISDHGRYEDFVNIGGQPTLIREPDGVHLNSAGSQLVANLLVPMIRHDWHIR